MTKFEFKSASDIEKMTDIEAKEYKDAMNAHFVALEKELREQIDLKGDKQTIEDLKKSVQEAHTALKLQGAEIAKRTVEVKGDMNTFQIIKKALEESKDKLAGLKSSDKGVARASNVSIAMKVDNLTFANSITGEIPQSMRLAGVDQIARRQPFILQLILTGSTSSNNVSWVEEESNAGDAGYTTEGTKKNQRSKKWKTNNDSLSKITAYIKVSEEMLEDIDFMASEINNDLMRQVELFTDAELLTGAGGAELNGIMTQATAFNAGAFAGTVVDPDLGDVVITMADQIEVANHMANYVILHNSDLTALKLKKDTLGRRLYPELEGANPTIGGLPVVTNSGVPIGYVLVMDSTKATAYFKNAIRLESDTTEDDFINNMRTFLCEVRLLLVIKGNNKPAFIKALITDAISDLTKGIQE